PTGTGAGGGAVSRGAGEARADGRSPARRPAGERDATEAVRARAPAGTEFAASDVLPRARAVSDAERGRPETLAGPGRPQALEPCASYRELVLYAPPRSACAIDLSDNTNAFGTPPAARSALRELELRAVSRYPSAYGDELRAALARHACVPLEEIITGRGSDAVPPGATALAAPAPGAHAVQGVRARRAPHRLRHRRTRAGRGRREVARSVQGERARGARGGGGPHPRPQLGRGRRARGAAQPP